MNLFIDTNVFLTFYHYSSDDLEELKKLSALLQLGDLKLFLPEQVSVEFKRNRANKIADALKNLRDQRLNLQFPQISKDYDQFEELRKVQKQYAKLHSELIQVIEQDVRGHSLKADSIVEELFHRAKRIVTTDDLIGKARLRVELGNPPGKKGSVGDAIIWEALLDTVPAAEALYFITGDDDYSSPFDTASIDPFLVEEWSERVKSELANYRGISEFFADKFPDIELATESEKDLLIRNLATGGTFDRTHQIISRLSKYSDFTPTQVNEIVLAAITNNQVYWIGSDWDVRTFLSGLVKGREAQIDPAHLKQLNRVLEGEEPSTEGVPI